jgi:Tol biopolymer transport system component
MVQVTNLAATAFETWTPDFSPDGRRLTFCYGPVDSSGNGFVEIYVMNVDGTGLTQLTNDGLFDCFPRWSPDGSTIIFARASHRTFQAVVTTMNPDGSDKKELSSPVWGIARSGFTPDGTRILWETQQGGFVSVLWIMDADGTHQRRLTEAPLKAGEVSAPSPDGKHVVFISNQNTPTTLPNVLVEMDIENGHLKRVTHPVGVSHDVYPNYSPDGTKIVFASDRMSTDRSLDIFTVNTDGSNLARIAKGVTLGGCADVNCVTPAWGIEPPDSNPRQLVETVPKAGLNAAAVAGPNATLSPTSLLFRCRNVINAGCQCITQRTTTLSNHGSAPLSIKGITTNGAFTQTDNCGTRLGPGKSCAIAVHWSLVNSSGAVNVSDNAPGSPQKVSLSGYKECSR